MDPQTLVILFLIFSALTSLYKKLKSRQEPDESKLQRRHPSREVDNDPFEEKGVDPPIFSCEMNTGGGRSRTGTCIFKINPKTFAVLIERLKLELVPDVIGLKGCLTRKSFKPSFSGKQEFDVYKSKEPPGPIVSGNTSTSFQLLSYRKSSSEGCIDVIYPYG